MEWLQKKHLEKKEEELGSGIAVNDATELETLTDCLIKFRTRIKLRTQEINITWHKLEEIDSLLKFSSKIKCKNIITLIILTVT